MGGVSPFDNSINANGGVVDVGAGVVVGAGVDAGFTKVRQL